MLVGGRSGTFSALPSLYGGYQSPPSTPDLPRVGSSRLLTQPSNAKADTLTDDFTTADSTKWVIDPAATVTGGQLVLTPNTSYSSKIVSVAQYALTGSSVAVEMVQRPNPGNGGTEAYLAVHTDNWSSNSVRWIVTGANLIGQSLINGSGTTVAVVPYSAVDHRRLRIRESGGSTFWETSPDGGTWTAQGNLANPFSMDSVGVTLIAGFYGTEPSLGTAIFDNVNVAPAASTPATAAGSITLGGSVTAGAVSTTAGSLTLGGTATAQARPTTSGAITLGGTSTAASTASASGSIGLGGTVAGGVTAASAGTLSLGGSVAATASVTAAGTVTLGGTVAARVGAVAGGTVTLSGAATVGTPPSSAAGSLILGGSATASARAAASGAIVLSGTATGTGAATATPATAAGLITLGGVATARVPATAAGLITLSGLARVQAARRNWGTYGATPGAPRAYATTATSRAPSASGDSSRSSAAGSSRQTSANPRE